MRYPTSFGNLACAADRAIATPKQIAIIGRFDDALTQALVRTVFEPYVPNKVVAAAEPGDRESEQSVPLLEDRIEPADGPLVYVCENFTCQMPSADPTTVHDLIGVAPA
jgi:uncharacterized protein YyaL (SSP411 family)